MSVRERGITLEMLMEHADDIECQIILDLARRAELLWQCECCGWDNVTAERKPGDCENCSGRNILD